MAGPVERKVQASTGAAAVSGLALPPPRSDLMEHIQSLIRDGFDVTFGARRAPGAVGFYVSLEHLDLAEPEEFFGDLPGAALERARAWAAAWRGHTIQPPAAPE